MSLLRSKMSHGHVAWKSNASLTAQELQLIGKEPICCICDDLSDTSTKFAVLTCGHVFHIGCVSRWFFLSLNVSCPMCRTENCAIELFDFAQVYKDYKLVQHSIDRECAICRFLEPNKTCAKTVCGHEFHFDCITKWIGIRKACPLCNRGSSAELFLQFNQ